MFLDGRCQGAVFSLEDQSSQQLRNNHVKKQTNGFYTHAMLTILGLVEQNQFQKFMDATVSRLEALEQEQV
jgi:hypothetical protein